MREFHKPLPRNYIVQEAERITQCINSERQRPSPGFACTIASYTVAILRLFGNCISLSVFLPGPSY